MPRYGVGLGSNLGDRLKALRDATSRLGALGIVEARSSVYETAPIGPPQPHYLNAAVRLQSACAPRELLAKLLEIERAFGRERGERWGPRTLDLDILVWDGPAVADVDLVVPHPHLHERAFALIPLAEVWADMQTANSDDVKRVADL